MFQVFDEIVTHAKVLYFPSVVYNTIQMHQVWFYSVILPSPEINELSKLIDVEHAWDLASARQAVDIFNLHYVVMSINTGFDLF